MRSTVQNSLNGRVFSHGNPDVCKPPATVTAILEDAAFYDDGLVSKPLFLPLLHLGLHLLPDNHTHRSQGSLGSGRHSAEVSSEGRLRPHLRARVDRLFFGLAFAFVSRTCLHFPLFHLLRVRRNLFREPENFGTVTRFGQTVALMRIRAADPERPASPAHCSKFRGEGRRLGLYLRSPSMRVAAQLGRAAAAPGRRSAHRRAKTAQQWRRQCRSA